MCDVNGRAKGSIDMKEEVGLMCAASERAAHCFIFLTAPCTGVRLGEGRGTAFRHNDWRRLCGSSFRFNFSICSVAGSGRKAFIFNASWGCQCQIKTMHMSHDQMNQQQPSCGRSQPVESNLDSAGFCFFPAFSNGARCITVSWRRSS